MLNIKSRILAFTMAVIIASTTAYATNSGIQVEEKQDTGKIETIKTEQPENYSDYLTKYTGTTMPVEKYTYKAEAALGSYELKDEYMGEHKIACIGKSGAIEWNTDISAEGLYAIEVKYNTLLGKQADYRLSIEIDGKTPYDLAKTLRLRKIWKNSNLDADGKFKKRNGNNILPDQTEVTTWQQEYLFDVDGRTNDPLSFYLEKGKHNIKLIFDRGDIAVAGIEIKAPEQPESYSVQYEKWKAQGIKEVSKTTNSIKLEGEYADYKSDASIIPTSNRSNPATSPQNSSKVLLNTIGEDFGYYKAGQWISWTVDVNTAGLYRVEMRVKQDFVRGIQSARELLVDGEIQYKELRNITFDYGSDFYIKTVGGKKPMLIYLDAGKHTVTLRVNAQYAQIRREIISVVYDANTLYRRIIMITGAKPDQFNDYKLDEVISELIPTLKDFSKRLSSIRDEMLKSGFQKGGEIVSVEQFKTIVDSFIRKPDTIPTRLEPFVSGISTISAFYYLLGEQPLAVDYISLSSPDSAPAKANADFLTSLKFSFMRYLASYFEDYTTLSDVKSEEALNVWVNLGRDQAQIIKEMAENTFMVENKIPVKINLVQQALIPATLSGDGPDISLFTSPIDTVNLAVRNTLLDLSKFDDFNKVTERFQKNSKELYSFNKHYYGLPVTETYYMMFYRKDILKDLGLKVPNTWNEFNNTLVTLQRNHLTMAVPSPDSEVDASTGGVQFAMLETLLFQHGGSYYDGSWNKSGLGSPEALDAFKQITDFFVKYSVPTTYDFYSRFRTGEIAVGIQRYNMYNQLMIAAPEIKGLWEMAPIPALVRKDGTMDRSVSSVGTSAIIFNKTKNPKGAWEFLKWFTSASVQSEYARRVELMLGSGARPETANIEAFQSLPWGDSEREMLMEQWRNVRIMNMTPVSYYVNRNITNAFRKVVYQGNNARETLNLYNSHIEKEMERKQLQFNK